MFEPEGLDSLVEVGTSQKEIDRLIEEQKEKKRLAEIEYKRRIESGEPLLPIMMRVQPQTVGMDLVSVQPMTAPSGKASIMDVVYVTNEDKISYPYSVTEENIEEVKKNWELTKHAKYSEHGEIQVGDVIDEWKYGGALSMRKGEMIVRDGIEIYTRLTAMS